MQEHVIGIGHNHPPADFASRAQVVAYAERLGLNYSAEPEPVQATQVKRIRPWQWNRRPVVASGPGRSAVACSAAGASWRTAERTQLPDLDRALVNPAAVFSAPADVLGHPRLMSGCKREILQRWAWDEHLKEIAAAEGMAAGEPSRLDEVKAALLSLGVTWRPKPYAPAAAAPILQHDLEVLAA